MNKKVVALSILALGFVALTYLVSGWFIIGAAIIIYINQRELFHKKQSNLKNSNKLKK